MSHIRQKLPARKTNAGHSSQVDDRGLDRDGTIAREGSLDRVSTEFAPVVEAFRRRVVGTFVRLHSAYLYGSVPRGTALPGTSDLDALLAFHDEPTDADRREAGRIEDALDREFPQINGAGIQLDSARTLLSDAERHDGGFFVACLCTPLLGRHLAEHLPRYRPTSVLARETNGDLGALLPDWRKRAAEVTDRERQTLSRTVARRIVRTGFTLVMPRWGGWTSDLARSAELFGHYYPDRRQQMRTAARTAREPTADPAILAMLIDDLAPWLAAEYTATHGERTPRP
ncbi:MULTISPECIES: nucleotidyltransferase domain-containing protein [Amycolatopsis]|uniref:nucleotidyltransferase domain-containing protein n=1 Tax=Amycolatopsis TaxID=1813 RepID=UPI001E36A0B5|nr:MULTISPECIES: nucleotidyltransferase domain-containing protein [Amycolatopsis]